jgi:predicted glycosyltransferase
LSNILIDLGHPAHVHLFRNAARLWEAQGHTVLFSALDREMILELLRKYNLPYQVTYKRRSGKLAKVVELIFRTLSTYRIARRFKADLFVSFGNPTVGVPAMLMGKPYLAFTDTDHAVEQHRLFKPFVTVIATPDVFTRDLGPKQVRYAGFHELAYLHPDEFTPDPAEIEALGLRVGEPFFLVRFVAWNATHDVGHHGFSLDEKRQLLNFLRQHGKVLLSVEGEVDPEFVPLVTSFPSEKIHHLLAFATLYIGEGGTMASEAAILGTPSIFVSTLWAGVWEELQKYGLLYAYPHGTQALTQVKELLEKPDLKAEWRERQQQFLSHKIDPTPWLVETGNQLLQQASEQRS